MTKTYKIEFTSNNGNYNTVEVYAHTEDEARRIFEEGYMYEEILSIEEVV